MDRMIYTAMSGARSVMQRQDTIANNLANASTPGYRAQTTAFRAVEAGAAAGSANSAANGASTRAFAVETSTGSDFTPGTMQRTGRELDLAIDGKGWFAVQGPDGREAYTRAGAMEVDAQGVLRSPGGRAVLGDGGPITIPPDSIVSVGTDGSVSATPATGPRSAVVTLGRIKLVNPAEQNMVKGDDGLFRTRDGKPAAADAAVSVSPRTLEGSNVNPIESMVGMISAARQFELQMRLLSTADQNAKSATQLLAVGG